MKIRSSVVRQTFTLLVLLCGTVANGMDMGSGQALWQPIPRSTGSPTAQVSLPQPTRDLFDEAVQRLEEAYGNNVAFHDFADNIIRHRSQRHWRDVITTIIPIDRLINEPHREGVMLNDFEHCITPYAWGLIQREDRLSLWLLFMVFLEMITMMSE